MDNRRLSKEKQALVLAALCEGTPIAPSPACSRTEKNVITRIIRETGEAFADYMDKEFRDLPLPANRDGRAMAICRLSRWPDGKQRKTPERGDFWLWACIDADTKLVFSHRVGKRDWINGWHFVGDVRERVKGPVQIATDQLPAYVRHIRNAFRIRGLQLRNRDKDIRRADAMLDGTLARLGQQRGRSQDGDSGAQSGSRLAGLSKASRLRTSNGLS